MTYEPFGVESYGKEPSTTKRAAPTSGFSMGREKVKTLGRSDFWVTILLHIGILKIVAAL
jgi:hypothetical protein